MAEITVKRIEAFHRVLLQGDAAQLSVPEQRLTMAAAIELTCALYQAGKDASAMDDMPGRSNPHSGGDSNFCDQLVGGDLLIASGFRG